jgi:hypothetical protein
MKRFILPFILATATTAAWAQPQVSVPVETVTSEAQRAQDDDTAHRFVQSVLAQSPTMENQYAKWKAPVCPHVYGLTPTAAYVIEQRIKEIARQVGAPVDRNDPCIPNIGIIVTADPQKSFDSLAARAPYLVITSSRRTKVEHPVETWYASMLRDYNGKLNFDQSWEDAGLDGPPMVPAQLSRLSTGQTAEMGAATVLVNAQAVTGLSLGTLADYIALQTLAQSQVAGRCQNVPSIANLLLAGCDTANHVEQLSDLDLALLTGLYAAPDRPELLQRQRIIGAMKRALAAQRGH